MLDHSSHHKKIDDLKLHEDNENQNDDVKYQINNVQYEEEEEDEIFDDQK